MPRKWTLTPGKLYTFLLYLPFMKTLVVGAGFSGAVVARQLVDHLCFPVDVIDKRNHLAGNCHTYRNEDGIQVHAYGPHIFNTNRDDVWAFITRFGQFNSFVNRVKAVHSGSVFTMPINLHTINQFYGTAFSPQQAREHLAKVADSSIADPQNFEEQALSFIGKDLYEAFFRDYTIKQWGCDPRELPASILKRLPVRFDYNDNYYNAKHQGIPVDGYTSIVQNLLDHELISINLGEEYCHEMAKSYDIVIYTGAIDEYFQHSLGRLGYRTVEFKSSTGKGDYQGNAVINYPSLIYPFTRVHEHKHFAPWESHEATIWFEEYSKETGEDDTPYYPKRLPSDMNLYERYRELAAQEGNVYFVGRLGSYRYLNMDQAIGEALTFAADIISQYSR